MISTLSHQERMEIGIYLAELGDPRPGVGLRPGGLPDIAWCEVKGGKITLEGKAGTFRVEPFYIAKYPVTWIQYRTFLEAEDGYRNKIWWKGLAQREDAPGVQYRKHDNYPAENVSWYDAVAFCRWLSKRLGYDIRLPTEWEWQQAATGGDKANEYPWGRDWDSEKANTTESGLSRTTAVGLYPKGASPVGALDMSGNVMEWCLNEYNKPKNVEVSSSETRVVRGGSWGYVRSYARAASRNDFRGPGFRHGSFGFRLCCASPIL
jgi:formylglycine-generating enzyme required for sulfatase activity